KIIPVNIYNEEEYEK
uniref:Predicted gene 11096 n=1 Tax=Mus spicilegus TaxID=10103 RepID=A0A8C6GKS1_MUSSI